MEKLKSSGDLNLNLVVANKVYDIKGDIILMYTRSAILSIILQIIRINNYFNIIDKKYKEQLEDPKESKFKTIKGTYNKNLFIEESTQIDRACSLFNSIIFNNLYEIVTTEKNIIFRLYNVSNIFHLDVLRLCCDIYEDVSISFEDSLSIDRVIVKCSKRITTEDVRKKLSQIEKGALYLRLYSEEDSIFSLNIRNIFIKKYNDLFLNEWKNFLIRMKK